MRCGAKRLYLCVCVCLWAVPVALQEARLAVTEEFVLELRRDFHDVVGPTLEKLAAHVSDLRKGQGQVGVGRHGNRGRFYQG